MLNVFPTNKRTAAEEALFDAYETYGNKNGASETAIVALKEHGLPSRRVESWHYTDLRNLLKDVPALAGRPDADKAAKDAASYAGMVDAVRVPIFDGHAFADLGGSAPQGASISVTQTALEAEVSKDNAIGLMTQALAGDCVHVAVDAGATIDTPIGLAHVAGEAAALAVSQQSVEIAAGATATVIERYVQDGDGEYQNSAVTNLTVGDNANATYVISQQMGAAATHLGQINITIGVDAKLMLFVLNAGGKLVRQEVNVNVAGEGSDFQLRGVNLIGDSQHIDVTMDLRHNVPNTTSEEIIRNVVTGKGKGVFQGRIAVAQIAQKTDAKMACNTLLLSDDGDFSTKPELEIFADDVLCGHGATFTDLEPSYLFYLMSRGIREKDARALLIKGFVDEIVEDLNNEALESAFVGVIDGWLDANG